MRRRFTIVFFCFLMGVGTFGCKGKSTRPFRIGIAQFIDHPALDETRRGFTEELARLGFSEKDVIYDYQNAQGSLNDASVIADRFVGKRYDLVFSIATPMTQVMKRSASKSQIPIVFGSITDPVSAGLVESLEHPGQNITGTSDRWPYEEQIKLVRSVLPGASKLCVVLNPGEDNTRYAMEEVKKAADQLKLTLVEGPVTSTAEVYSAAETIAGRCDAFYVPADNIAMAAAPTIVRVATEHRLPTFAGDPDTFKAGCIAGVGVSYYDLGVEAAKMASRILRNHELAGDIPVATSKDAKVLVNQDIAMKLNIKIPAEILSQARADQ